jgi:hypothetical protein
MPIRFACTSCRQALQISSRKAGTRIQCPKCQTELTVPAAEREAGNAANPVAKAAPKPTVAPERKATAAPPSKAQPAPTETTPATKTETKRDNPSISSLNIELTREDVRPAKLEPDFKSIIVFDDVPAMLNTPVVSAAPALEVRPEPAPAAVPFDPRLVAVSRTVLYAQAILIAAVAILSFSLGYFAGRGAGQPTPEELMANAQPVLVEGDVVYQTNGGDSPDTGAVVIAVPHSRAPGQKFSIQGLKPADPLGPDGAVNPAIQAVETEGGAYVRADQNGQFRMNIRPGKYWVLAISAASARPAGMLPTIHDVKTLGRYFENAADLLADRRYQLAEVQLPQDAPLEIALDAKR